MTKAMHSRSPDDVPVMQPTTFGRPRLFQSYRFYIIAKRWLAQLNSVIFILIAISIAMTIGLTIYLSFFATYKEVYASDGTQYSCKIETAKALK